MRVEKIIELDLNDQERQIFDKGVANVKDKESKRNFQDNRELRLDINLLKTFGRHLERKNQAKRFSEFKLDCF